jgi:hypothetical protein
MGSIPGSSECIVEEALVELVAIIDDDEADSLIVEIFRVGGNDCRVSKCVTGLAY